MRGGEEVGEGGEGGGFESRQNLLNGFSRNIRVFVSKYFVMI